MGEDLRMGLDPTRAGCAGSGSETDGRWRLCLTPPVATVAHEVVEPRRRVVRVFVCEAHAVGHPDPRPLTAADRAALRRRATPVRRPGRGAAPGSG